MLKGERAPDSPFQPGELDAHKVTEINQVIQALPDQEADKALAGLEAAIKEKRALGQFKEGLQMILNVAKSYGVGL